MTDEEKLEMVEAKIRLLIEDLKKCVNAEKRDHKHYCTPELMILRLKDML